MPTCPFFSYLQLQSERPCRRNRRRFHHNYRCRVVVMGAHMAYVVDQDCMKVETRADVGVRRKPVRVLLIRRDMRINEECNEWLDALIKEPSERLFSNFS